MAKQDNSPVDEAEIKRNLAALDKQIDLLTPHINKAHAAFGGMEDLQATIQDIKNRVAQARSVYGH